MNLCAAITLCRLIIPGYIGGRMIKWLEEITVTEVRLHMLPLNQSALKAATWSHGRGNCKQC